MMLNQNEREPLPVEDQVIPDLRCHERVPGHRINVERVTEFLHRADRSGRFHSQLTGDLRAKIAGGDWSEETQKQTQDFIESFRRTSAMASTRRVSRSMGRPKRWPEPA